MTGRLLAVYAVLEVELRAGVLARQSRELLVRGGRRGTGSSACQYASLVVGHYGSRIADKEMGRLTHVSVYDCAFLVCFFFLVVVDPEAAEEELVLVCRQRALERLLCVCVAQPALLD